MAATGHLVRCLAIVRGGNLPALVFEATARLSSVRRGGRMLVGNDADVADGVAVACAAMIRLLRGLLTEPDHGGIAGHHEDGGDDTSAGGLRREFAVELIRDHRAIESCLDGVDAGVFDYEPPRHRQFPERLQSGPGWTSSTTFTTPTMKKTRAETVKRRTRITRHPGCCATYSRTSCPRRWVTAPCPNAASERWRIRERRLWG